MCIRDSPKCYTWLESCGSHLSDGIKKKIFFCILWSVWFSMTVRTDIFLYTEKLSYLPSFGGVRTFSHHQSFYREWIRKSFPVNREGLTVLKSILPCWWWEKCCTLSLCYLDAETRWWSSQKPKYQYRDNLVGQLTTSRASCDTQKQEWFCIFHLQQNYLHNHDNDDDLGH